MFSFTKNGKNHFGKVGDGTWLPLGSEVTYGSKPFLGLRKLGKNDIPYRAGDWSSVVGPWAGVLGVTSYPESLNNFDTLNTYDSAGFTFGFIQQAAHTADDNFALLLRRLIAAYPQWWGDLVVKNGTVHQVKPNGAVENLESGRKLQNYMNPLQDRIDEVERVNALKVIHLVITEPATRKLQVEAGVEGMKRKIRYWPDALDDIVSDRILSLVLSVLHWKGGTHRQVLRSLQAQASPEQAIIAFIKSLDASRGKKTEDEFKRQVAAGLLGVKKFRKSDGAWV